jgi:hypothetical protein
MEGIILVTGCDRVTSWTNVAFLEGVDTQTSFHVKVFDGFATENGILVLPGHVRERFCTKGLMERYVGVPFANFNRSDIPLVRLSAH